MKEVTRIHIAKISYDIEIAAKKELETYIHKLELYAADDELLQDIEIRITELLIERGVVKDGVITKDDVAAIREQLGEPEEFMDDEKATPGVPVDLDGDMTRKLYRDTESAVFGGVLSGIARFFRIDPIWIRLIFVILFFASYGTAALVYLVAWIAIPPARTAPEKLRMRGLPVTLQSIRDLSERDEREQPRRQRAGTLRRAIAITAGVVSTLAAIGSLFATIWGGILIFQYGYSDVIAGVSLQEPLYLAAAIGMIVSGALLTTLFTILAYAAFTGTYSKRLVVSTIVVIVSGIVISGTSFSLAAFHSLQASEQLRRDMVTKTVSLPTDFTNVKELKVDVGTDNPIAWVDISAARVEYIVSDTPRYELTALPETTPSVVVNGESAIVKIEQKVNGRYVATPVLKIYGPALQALNVESGSASYTTDRLQPMLAVTMSEKGGTTEVSGSYERVVAKGGYISLNASSIQKLDAAVGTNGRIEAGTVRELTVTQPDVCPNTAYSFDRSSKVVVQAVTSGAMTHNGRTIQAATYKTPCGKVLVGADASDEY